MQSAQPSVLARSTAAILCAAAALAVAPPAASGAERFRVTDATKPLVLIRGTSLLSIGAGALLEAGDIVETAGDAQVLIEAPPGFAFMLGPDTRALIGGAPPQGALDVVVLGGWVKARLDAGAPSSAQVQFGPARVDSAAGSSYVAHASATRLEAFSEAGTLTISAQPAPAAGHRVTAPPARLGADSYAVVDAGKPIAILDRPAPDFVATMPPTFRSPIYPIAARVPTVAVDVAKARKVDYADVAPWLKGVPSLRREMVARFRPRLADEAFRRALDAELGYGPDWKPILHPPPPPPPPTAAQPPPAGNGQ